MPSGVLEHDVFKAEGIKKTKHRSAILQIIQQSQQPLSAEDIFLYLKQQESGINLSTVYRILHFLHEKGILEKTELENRTLYELQEDEHAHLFYCNACKKMYKVNDCPLDAYAEQLKEQMGFDIVGHKLELYGLCKNCKSKEK